MRFILNQNTSDEIVKYFQASTRVKRAVTLVDHARKDSPDIYIVKSQTNGERYVADIRAGTCTCPDYVFRGSITGVPCKHVIASKIQDARERTLKLAVESPSQIPPVAFENIAAEKTVEAVI